MVQLKYDEHELIPVVAQDAATGQVLMVAYMTREAVAKTLQTGQAWYWSRSRRALWRKGAQSGHTQRVREVRVDCDGDALLVRVDPQGPACHTGHRSCFFRDVEGREAVTDAADALPSPRDILDDLFEVLTRRRAEMPSGSYTTSLLRAGRAAIAGKVMEEAEELTRAAAAETDQRVIEEGADLLYHAWLLLVERGVDLRDVKEELKRRRTGRDQAPLGAGPEVRRARGAVATQPQGQDVEPT